MFVIDCPTHGTQVLVSATRIRGLYHTTAGILVAVDCWCGTRVHLHTGRHHVHPAQRTGDVDVGSVQPGDRVRATGEPGARRTPAPAGASR